MFGITDVGLMLIVGAVILIFGAPKLVEWAKSLGEAKKAFADASAQLGKSKETSKTK